MGKQFFFLFFSIMKEKSSQQFSRLFLILIQTKWSKNELEIKRERGRERRGKEKGLGRKRPCIQVRDKCFQHDRSSEHWWVCNRDPPVTKYTRDTDTETLTSESVTLALRCPLYCLSLPGFYYFVYCFHTPAFLHTLCASDFDSGYASKKKVSIKSLLFALFCGKHRT